MTLIKLNDSIGRNPKRNKPGKPGLEGQKFICSSPESVIRLKFGVSRCHLSGITEVERVKPSNSHQKEATSHGIIEQRTEESFDR